MIFFSVQQCSSYSSCFFFFFSFQSLLCCVSLMCCDVMSATSWKASHSIRGRDTEEDRRSESLLMINQQILAVRWITALFLAHWKKTASTVNFTQQGARLHVNYLMCAKTWLQQTNLHFLLFIWSWAAVAAQHGSSQTPAVLSTPTKNLHLSWCLLMWRSNSSTLSCTNSASVSKAEPTQRTKEGWIRMGISTHSLRKSLLYNIINGSWLAKSFASAWHDFTAFHPQQ